MIRSIVIAALLGAGLLGGAAFGQMEPPVGRSGGFRVPEPHPIVTLITAENRPDRRYHIAETRLEKGTFDPLATPLVRASERFSGALFALTHLAFQRAVTYTVEQEDRFVAEWRFGGPVGTGSMILEDLPDRSTYYIKLAECKLRTLDEVRGLIASLLVANKPPANVVLARSTTKLYEEAGSLLGFSWAFDPEIPSPQPFLRHLWLMGTTDGKNWFLAVGVGKQLTLHYYPIQPYIPERFPPLTDRVKEWNSGRIRSELSKPTGPNLSGNRTEILLAELARRGLSVTEVTELLREAPPGEEAMRLQHILAVMKRSPDRLDVTAYFGPALRMYAQMGARGEGAADILFLEASKKCDAEVEARALELLRVGVLQQGPLDYLGSCSTSREVLQVLEAVMVRPPLEPLKSGIIELIRRRSANDMGKR